MMYVDEFDNQLDESRKYRSLYETILQNGFTPGDKNRCLVVDPNLTFAELLIATGSKHYQYTGSKSRLKTSIRDANSVRAYYVPHGKAVKKRYEGILIFATRDDEEEIEELIKTWYPQVAESGALHLYIARRILENRTQNPVWTAVKNCSSVTVYLFDQTEFVPGSPECCHVVLRKSISQTAGQNIKLARMRKTQDGIWQTTETAVVPAVEFEQHPYRQLDRMVTKDGYKERTNEEAVECLISREIRMWVSISPHRSKLRATYRIYRPAPEGTGRLHGDNIDPGSRTSQSGFDSSQQALESAETFLIKGERGRKLAEKCREMLKIEYQGKPISLKTLWFLYFPDMMALKKCKYIPLESLFMQQNSIDDPICSFPVSKDMDISLWNLLFDSFCDEQEELGEDVNRLKSDMNYLFKYAMLNLHCNHNPLEEWANDINKTRKARSNTRKRLGKHSLIPHEEKKLLEFLENDLTNIDLADALYFKYYTGISWRELIALTWQNILVTMDVTDPEGQERTLHKSMPFRRTPDLVKVRVQKYYDTKTDSVELLYPTYKMRDISLNTGVVNRLLARFERIRPGLDNPLFSKTDGGEGSNTGFSLGQVRDYVKKVVSSLDTSSLIVDVFDEEGEPVPTDLSRHQGDFFQSNFRHKIKEHARLEADNIAYLSGRVRVTTAGRHYQDYISVLPQRGMQVSLERWYSKSLPARDIVPKKVIPLEDLIGNPIVGSPGPVRQKIRLRIQVDTSDEKAIYAFRIQARHGFDLEILDEGA